MSPSSDPTRPPMRRKSSAQNLLSSFKPSPQSNITSSSYPSTPTPILNSPNENVGAMMGGFVRDWELQSVPGTVSSGGTLVAGSSPVIGSQGTSVEYLRDLVQKRIITLTYMRNVHEG
jgi:hypothetical protein